MQQEHGDERNKYKARHEAQQDQQGLGCSATPTFRPAVIATITTSAMLSGERNWAANSMRDLRPTRTYTLELLVFLLYVGDRACASFEESGLRQHGSRDGNLNGCRMLAAKYRERRSFHLVNRASVIASLIHIEVPPPVLHDRTRSAPDMSEPSCAAHRSKSGPQWRKLARRSATLPREGSTPSSSY